MKTLYERLLSRRVIMPNGCWQLIGRPNNTYAGIFGNKKTWPAHRVSYVENIGPLTDGLVVDHKCCNKACWNPDHLEEVSYAENSTRGVAAWGMTKSRELWLKQIRNSSELRLAKRNGNKRRVEALTRKKAALSNERAVMEKARKLDRLSHPEPKKPKAK